MTSERRPRRLPVGPRSPASRTESARAPSVLGGSPSAAESPAPPRRPRRSPRRTEPDRRRETRELRRNVQGEEEQAWFVAIASRSASGAVRTRVAVGPRRGRSGGGGLRAAGEGGRFDRGAAGGRGADRPSAHHRGHRRTRRASNRAPRRAPGCVHRGDARRPGPDGATTTTATRGPRADGRGSHARGGGFGRGRIRRGPHDRVVAERLPAPVVQERAAEAEGNRKVSAAVARSASVPVAAAWPSRGSISTRASPRDAWAWTGSRPRSFRTSPRPFCRWSFASWRRIASPAARQNLAPAAMAVASPRVFWAIVRHGVVGGGDGIGFAEALERLAPGAADWASIAVTSPRRPERYPVWLPTETRRRDEGSLA